MSSPNVERRVTERNTEPDGDKTAEEDNRNDHQDTLDFSDEYEQWKSQTGEVLGHVDRLRQTLDDRTLQVRSESFQTLFEDCDGVEAMRSELVRVWKTLRATQTFVDEDFGSSMEALRLSLAAYSEATLERLNNERKELAGIVIQLSSFYCWSEAATRLVLNIDAMATNKEKGSVLGLENAGLSNCLIWRLQDKPFTTLTSLT